MWDETKADRGILQCGRSLLSRRTDCKCVQLPAQIGQTPCDCHTAGNSKSGQKGLLSEMPCSRQIIGDDCVHAVVEGASGNEGNGSGDEERRRRCIAVSGKNFGIQSGTETGQQIVGMHPGASENQPYPFFSDGRMHRGASLHFKDPHFCGAYFERVDLQARLAGRAARVIGSA